MSWPELVEVLWPEGRGGFSSCRQGGKTVTGLRGGLTTGWLMGLAAATGELQTTVLHHLCYLLALSLATATALILHHMTEGGSAENFCQDLNCIRPVSPLLACTKQPGRHGAGAEDFSSACQLSPLPRLSLACVHRMSLQTWSRR